jgi:hypothetical protein
VYTTRSAYNFTFDPHIKNIYQVQILSVPKSDVSYYSLVGIEKGDKSRLPIELFPCDVLVSTSPMLALSIVL